MSPNQSMNWIIHRPPATREELFARFDQPDGTSKHLLILYSLVIGLNAKTIVELGLGLTTGVLRAAAAATGGTVYSCDHDKRRFQHLLSEQDERWKLQLEASSVFLRGIPGPIDLFMHDGAHDYVNVKRDLEIAIPKMRQFGLICVHDTQQVDLHQDMLAAIADATRNFSVSITNLPFNSGMAIIRVESGSHPPISPTSGRLIDDRFDTYPVAFPTSPSGREIEISRSFRYLVAAKIRLGHLLRQAGLRR